MCRFARHSGQSIPGANRREPEVLPLSPSPLTGASCPGPYCRQNENSALSVTEAV